MVKPYGSLSRIYTLGGPGGGESTEGLKTEMIPNEVSIKIKKEILEIIRSHGKIAKQNQYAFNLEIFNRLEKGGNYIHFYLDLSI